VASEFVCTSVTSNNLDDTTGSPPRTTSLTVEAGIQTNNRHVKYLNFDDHGYSVLDVTAARTQMDYYVISDRADPQASASWTASWATEAGSQRVHAVDRPVAEA
jgi:alkaline phosphatase D